MKYIQALVTMAVGVSVLAFSGDAVAQSVKPCIVTVVRIEGQARYSLGNNKWHPLVVGKTLGSGAIIQSAVNSSVDIVLSANPVLMPQAAGTRETIPTAMAPAADPNVRGYIAYKPRVQQNVIRMFGNSVLAVDKLTQFNSGVDAVSDTELDLRAGKIFLNVKKMSASSQFIIKIPNGVAGIRGSSGCISADGTVQWYKGEIIISLINSKTGQPVTTTIHGGFGFDPQTGQVLQVSPSVLNFLQRIGVSVPSVYVNTIDHAGPGAAHNLATVYVSPVQGNQSEGSQGNQGNQNPGQD